MLKQYYLFIFYFIANIFVLNIGYINNTVSNIDAVYNIYLGGYTMARRGNRIIVPEARQALNQMKIEIANELGLSNYENIDKGNLSSRQNGYVGGYMTKRLVEQAERQMSGK